MADDQAKAAYERRAAAQRELTEQAEHVMATSKPTPTQEENDLIAVGAIGPMDIAHVDQPEMPPLHEQQATLDEAAAAEHSGSPRRSVPREQHRPAAHTGATGATGAARSTSTSSSTRD
jgi:hypothetical protein